jgi:hypothetical protein
MQFAFDPATQRRSNVILNSRAAALAGMHKEEVLARLAAHEAPLAALPLDFLRIVLHQALRAAVAPSGGRHADVLYVRMVRTEPRRRGANLARVEAIKLFNGRGQVTQVSRADPARPGPFPGRRAVRPADPAPLPAPRPPPCPPFQSRTPSRSTPRNPRRAQLPHPRRAASARIGRPAGAAPGAAGGSKRPPQLRAIFGRRQPTKD